jgi:hypothetical protein
MTGMDILFVAIVLSLILLRGKRSEHDYESHD